jgi:hypothetical protein
VGAACAPVQPRPPQNHTQLAGGGGLRPSAQRVRAFITALSLGEEALGLERLPPGLRMRRLHHFEV